MTKAIRGAIQLERNSSFAMETAVARLLKELLQRNRLEEEDLVSVLFSQTEDLDADNPARCLRLIGFSDVPLFCTQEPRYPSSLPRVIRVLVTAERDSWESPPTPVYLEGAEKLRPDLTAG